MSIIINPNEPLQKAEAPLVIEQAEDGSARLVHRETGAFIAFFKDGTILVRDAHGSGVQSLPTGDLLVGAVKNVINLGTNIAFRGQQPNEVAWVFEGETKHDMAQLDESSESVSAPDSGGDVQDQLGTEHDDGGASTSS